MNVSTVNQYVLNTGIGAAGGALFSMLIQNFQVWRSPNGGIIACLFAERITPNPLHINKGLILAVNATVPMDYVLEGKIVPTVCTFKMLLISCIGLGILIGVR